MQYLFVPRAHRVTCDGKTLIVRTSVPMHVTHENEEPRIKSNLVVIAYDDPFKAEEVRTQLCKLQQEYLIDLDDAVVGVTI